MLWSLDELKSSLLDEVPILTTSEGEGYIKYYLTPLFNDLRLHVSSFFDLGNLGEFGDVGAYFHRAYSEINALHG